MSVVERVSCWEVNPSRVRNMLVLRIYALIFYDTKVQDSKVNNTPPRPA